VVPDVYTMNAAVSSATTGHDGPRRHGGAAGGRDLGVVARAQRQHGAHVRRAGVRDDRANASSTSTLVAQASVST
jgi:hypothetical protein